MKKYKNFIYNYLLNKESNFFFKNFNKLLKNSKISLLDIGAAGDIELRWKRISRSIEYTGLEPDDRSYQLLINKKNDCFKYNIIKKAVWSSKSKIKYHLYEGWEQSSHYKPNQELTSIFPDNQRFNIVKTEILEMSTIDKIVDRTIDFIKIDAQGGELEIIKGCKKKIEHVLGVELEIGIAPIYKDQPLLNEVYQKMKELNFEFIDFISLRRWERSSNNTGYGQIIFSDGLFLRSPEYIVKNYSKDKTVIRKYIAILFVYNRFDLFDTLMNSLKKIYPIEIKEWNKVSLKFKKRFNKIKKIDRIIKILFKFIGTEYSSHTIY